MLKRRFGLSDTQIDVLIDGKDGSDIFPNLQSTLTKLLELGLVKKVAARTEREKGWIDARIKRLSKRAIKHLRAGRIKKANWILDEASDQLFDRDEVNHVITKKGLAIVAKIEEAEANNQLIEEKKAEFVKHAVSFLK